MRLIGLLGKSLCGKTTVGQMLIEHDPRGATLAFSDKLKEVAMDLFGFTHDDVYTEEGKARKTDMVCYKCPACGSINADKLSANQVVCRDCTAIGEPQAFASFWTPRMVLQHLGTEGARRVDPNVWAKHAIRRASAMFNAPLRDVGAGGLENSSKLFVVINDCRFKSEMAAIKGAGGAVWRLRRPETDRRGQGLAGHASETEMDTIPDSEFDYNINNDSDLNVLRGYAVEGLKRFLASRG